MKTMGHIRRIDDLGRVVIPASLRRALELGENDEVEITREGDRLVLQKHRHTCVFCGSGGELALFRDKHVCTACLEQLSRFHGDPI